MLGKRLNAAGEQPMSLAPLLQASTPIQLHAFAALGAFALGTVQLAAPKGTLPHRIVGSIWLGTHARPLHQRVFYSSIADLGAVEPVHLLAIFTLVM